MSDKISAASNRRRQNTLAAISTLCRVFWGPDVPFCRELLEGAALAPFETLFGKSGHPAAADLGRLQTAVGAFNDPDSLCEHLEQAYVRLFVSHHGGISAPLYQSCYEGQNATLMGPAALDMRARLERRGLNVSADLREPPDHLAIELEYLYFLLEKGWREGDHGLLREAAEFSSAVMLPWLTRFNRRLAGETECCFYPLAATLLVHVLEKAVSRQLTRAIPASR